MDDAVHALTELSAVDGELSTKEAAGGPPPPSLKKRRLAIRDAISSNLLEGYDVLSRLGCRPVVVPMRGAYCGGCSLRLPPQQGAALRKRQSLSVCPHCRRFLYAPAPVAEHPRAVEPRRKAAPAGNGDGKGGNGGLRGIPAVRIGRPGVRASGKRAAGGTGSRILKASQAKHDGREAARAQATPDQP